MRRALAVVLAALVVASPLAADPLPTGTGGSGDNEVFKVATVPQAKLVKAVHGWRALRLENLRLRRMLNHSPSVQEAKSLAEILYGIPRSELDYTVKCESSGNPRAVNGRYRGNMQLGPIFNGTPFARLDVFSPYVNILAGAYIWRTGNGWAPWECSPHGAFQP